MSDGLPWFPFFVDKWETDPKVRAMGPVARSYYLILLIQQWREGHIPECRKTLQRLLVLPCDPVKRLPSFAPDFNEDDSGYEFDRQAVINQVLTCFESDGNGGLVNATLADLRIKNLAICAAKSKGGKAKKVKDNERVIEDSSKTPGVDLDLDLEVLKIKTAHPTLADVTTYCLQRNNHIDPARWVDHYSSNGWKVGKNPMKDWRAAVRTWEKNEIGGSNGNTPSRTQQRVANNQKAILAGLNLGPESGSGEPDLPDGIITRGSPRLAESSVGSKG